MKVDDLTGDEPDAEPPDAKPKVDLTLAGIARALDSTDSGEPSNGGEKSGEPTELPTKKAAVAMILREREQVEILLIERATRPGDPWSGQVAMPGGRQDESDRDSIATAIRETNEEVGLQLSRDHWLGPLGELGGPRRRPSITIQGHCFGVPPETQHGALEAAEVATAFWVPLAHLLDPDVAVHYRYRELPEDFPGLLLPDSRNVLWGLTHRFVDDLLKRLGTRLARPSVGSDIHHHQLDVL